MNRHDLGCLAVAITSYLTSEYFTGLAPGTQRMRRRLLNNVFAEVQRLSADGPSETPVDLPRCGARTRNRCVGLIGRISIVSITARG